MSVKTEAPSPGDSRVALVLPSLVGGGAERVATDLANHWAQQGRDVTLITLDAQPERYPLDERVQLIGLDLLRESRSFAAALWNNRLRVRGLRRAIRDSGAKRVISFTDIMNVTTLLACRGLDVGVVVCERTDPRQHQLGRVWTTLRARTYRRAHSMVVQTQGVASWAAAQNWKCPVHVIPNAAPVLRPLDTKPGRSTIDRPTVVAVGRLSWEKGFDLLIQAFARVAAEHPEWQLRIEGEGRERSVLTALLQDQKLAERVSLPGWNPEIETVLRSADLFVLPSRYEGFPNALLEAMAAGVACIAFDCDSGPREIIRDGIDGLLVPAGNVGELARALHRLMSDPGLRARLGERARDVTERFSREAFYRRWDDVLTQFSPS